MIQDTDQRAQAQAYPLFCWDTGDLSSEGRYKGPFDTELEANVWLVRVSDEDGEGWTIRKCRRLGAGDLMGHLGELVEALDLWASEGNLPEAAWARWDDEIVTTRGPEADLWVALIKAVDPHLLVDAFVCEGDEETYP